MALTVRHFHHLSELTGISSDGNGALSEPLLLPPLLKITDAWFCVYLRHVLRAASFLLFHFLRTTLRNVSPKPFVR